MRTPTPYLICEHCDSVYARPDMGRRRRVRCPRCKAIIARHFPLNPGNFLALIIGALIVFVIANCYPIVSINIQGSSSSSTLWEAIAASYGDGDYGVTVLAAATIFFAPLIELLTLIYILTPLCSHKRPPGLVSAMTVLKWLHPWGMIDIFLLGTLVTVAKIGDLAEVTPGIGLYCFAALTLLIVAMRSISIRDLWEMVEEALE